MENIAPAPNGSPAQQPPAEWSEPPRDIDMKDDTAAQSPATQSNRASRAHTPSRPPTEASKFPAVANPNGAPARIYLNTKVTPHLLEGVKYLAVHEPEKPLKWLAEYLAKKSEELEGV